MAAASPRESRGLDVERCARLAASSDGRPTVSSRLVQRAGEDLARLLMKALAGEHRRPRA
jgi:hypothetical protein